MIVVSWLGFPSTGITVQIIFKSFSSLLAISKVANGRISSKSLILSKEAKDYKGSRSLSEDQKMNCLC